MAIVGALAALANDSGTVIGGALIALVLVGVIFGIEIPLIVRSQHRREAERLRRLPSGTYFARTAATVMAGRRLSVTGTLTVDTWALTFAPRRLESLITLPWPTIATVTVRPVSGRIQHARLTIGQFDGSTRSFTVSGHSRVVAALRQTIDPQPH